MGGLHTPKNQYRIIFALEAETITPPNLEPDIVAFSIGAEIHMGMLHPIAEIKHFKMGTLHPVAEI